MPYSLKPDNNVICQCGCTYVCMYVCMHACIHIYIRIHTHPPTHEPQVCRNAADQVPAHIRIPYKDGTQIVHDRPAQKSEENEQKPLPEILKSQLFLSWKRSEFLNVLYKLIDINTTLLGCCTSPRMTCKVDSSAASEKKNRHMYVRFERCV